MLTLMCRSHALQLRLRKLFLTALFAIIFALQAVSLGWAVAERDDVQLSIQVMHLFFSLYLIVVSALTIKKEYSVHTRMIFHICGLTFLASALLGTTALLPTVSNPITSFFTAVLAGESPNIPLALWYTTVFLYVVSCITAFTTPTGPPLHYPSEQIYSDKTLMAVTSKYEDNVCGITGASLWDMLMFSYTTKVVMLGYTSESLEIGDLPIVPSDMRSTDNYSKMRAAVRRWKLRIGSWRPRPGSGWTIAYRLLRVNIGPFIMIVILATTAATLFYTPMYFLNKIVDYVQHDPERRDRSWGWFYCAGLFSANAVCYLGNRSYVYDFSSRANIFYSNRSVVVRVNYDLAVPSSYAVELDFVRQNSCP